MPDEKPTPKPGFFEPGQPWYVLDPEEIHAVWYGILDTFGRFHEGELTPDEDKEFLQRRHYFWAGQIIGIGVRAIAGAVVIYLSSGNLNAALISIFLLMAGDQVLGGSGKK
jgi:hypothetical protein